MNTAIATSAPLFSAAWFKERSQVLKSISVGVVTWPLVIGAAWALWPSVDLPADMSGRLAYGLQLAVWPAFFLLLANIGSMRVFDNAGAEDPFANAETHALKINQRVLQNTLEQMAIFLPLLLALTVRIAPEHARLLPVSVAVWCLGRVIFWIGYRISIYWRGPGFDWTVSTTMLVAGWLVYTAV